MLFHFILIRAWRSCAHLSEKLQLNSEAIDDPWTTKFRPSRHLVPPSRRACTTSRTECAYADYRFYNIIYLYALYKYSYYITLHYI